jgi:hypothetical protein
MAIKLDEAKRKDAEAALESLKDPDFNSTEDALFEEKRLIISDALKVAAQTMTFTPAEPLPLIVLIRLWLMYRASGYLVSVEFEPTQKLAFRAYC